jgi:hypothetical protein
MMPPKAWPTRLWVATIAVGLLLAHAIGLTVHLVFVELAGGFPQNIGAGNAPALSPAVDTYGAHVIHGIVPGVIVLIVGLISAIPAARDTDVDMAAWGRVFLAALALVSVALLALGFQWLRIGW